MGAHTDSKDINIHVPHALEYTDTATREAATPDESYLKKLALQLDDYSLWVLQSISPTVWVAVGGGSGTVLKTTWSPDVPPATPTAQDDEFTGGSLDPKWTEFDPNAKLTVNVSATHKKMILTCQSVAGGETLGISQSIPAGNFTIFTKVSWLGKWANYGALSLALWENPADVTKRVNLFGMGIASGNYTFQSNAYTDYNSYSSTVFTTNLGCVNSVYLRMRRNGANYYHAFSIDGLGWTEMSSAYNPAYTPTAFGVCISNNNIGVDQAGVVDFFRYVASDLGVIGMMSGALAGIYE